MAATAGMTLAIMNPLHAEDMNAIRAANALLGFDPDCRKWLNANRPESEPRPAPVMVDGVAAPQGEAPRQRRENRRRAPAAV